MGYSYFGAHGQLKPQGISYSSINAGAMGSVAYYMNKYVGGEAIFSAHPNGRNDVWIVAARSRSEPKVQFFPIVNATTRSRAFK